MDEHGIVRDDFLVPSVLGHILAGKIRALAVTTDRRVQLIPEAPTTAEAGMPEFTVAAWLGIFLPANTPVDIVARLNAEVDAALAAPDVAFRVSQIGGHVSQSTVAEFTRFYLSELERWKSVAVRANVKVE